MTNSEPAGRPEVAVFYFPSWHADPRNDRWKHPGFTEWELVQAARPRFPGHRQPLVPEWGYFDESDPDTMDRATRVAAEHGVDAFLFDWYWYEDADFLNGALDRGYLARPEQPVRFALHWANHDWTDVFPAKVGEEPTFLAPAKVTADEFVALSDHLLERYLSHPGYWRVADGAYFSWHQFGLFVDWMGGWAQVREVLADFRARARRAGVGKLHLTCVGGISLTDGDGERLREAGVDSFTPYNWLHVLPLDQGLSVPYAQWRELAQRSWQTEPAQLSVPYAPNVTMGWDSTARVDQDDDLVVSTWPRLPVVVDNTAEQFGAAVRDAVRLARDSGVPYLTVNAWNEWTEGSYLEPEVTTGYAYLHALRAATSASGDR
ncbi:glycoside hydrolase family 99-like domain-containing protein [Micromonospora sp. LZ34]